MHLFSSKFDKKKGVLHKDNADHYVVVDSGSAAEKSYTEQGYKADPTVDVNAPPEEDPTAAATEAAEKAMAEEEAQRKAALAEAAASGAKITPVDQAQQKPVTDTPTSEAVKAAAKVDDAPKK